MSRSATQTRTRILSAAASEILAVGYGSATLSSIAARIGVTKGALAYHFPTKAAVASSLFDHLQACHQHMRDEIRAHGIRGARALVTLVVGVHALTQTDPVYAAAFATVVLPTTTHLDVPPVLPSCAEVFADHLREARADGETPPDIDPVAAGEDLLAVTLGMYALRAQHPTRHDTQPFRLLRRHLVAIGITGAGAIVDDVLAASPSYEASVSSSADSTWSDAAARSSMALSRCRCGVMP